MSVLALVFFSDLQATLCTRLRSAGQWLSSAALHGPPPVPRDRPHLLRDAGLALSDAGLAVGDAGLPFHEPPFGAPRLDDRWRKAMVGDPVYRSHWML